MRRRKFNFYSAKILKKLTAPKTDRYIQMDGVDDYAIVEDVTWLNTAVAGDFTWESWLYVPVLPDQPRFIFTTRQNFSGGNTFQVMLAWNNQIIFDNGSASVSSQDTIPAGQWFHCAIVVNKSANTYSFYRDGVLKRAVTGLPLANLISPITFASRNYGVGAADTFIRISFKETRVWNTVRTQAQIQENMGLTFTSPAPNLIANWRFNGDGLDSSGFGKNATVHNGAAFKEG